MKKIIAPIDFSDTSLNAAIYAGNLAEFYGADLWLYHAYGISIPMGEIDAVLINPTQMKEAIDFEIENFKNKIQSQLRRTLNINVKIEIAFFKDGLSAFCDTLQPDLVVMGLSGKSTLTKLVVGSNTIRAIQQISFPILVVPSKAQFIPIRKIGFACDYKVIKDTPALDWIKKITKDFNADLFVLNVEFNQQENMPLNTAQEMLVSDKFKELKPSYQTVLSADITEGINWFAKNNNIDFVVVIPKKHNLVEKLFSRSQTKNLLYHTHIPVLCLHE